MLNNKIKFLVYLFVFVLFSFSSFALSPSVQYRRNVRKLNAICWEIGKTATLPKVCKKPSMTMYKGVACWGCPEASRCNPICRGGKVCVNQKCVCPPNQYLYDCNGRCISPTIPCTK